MMYNKEDQLFTFISFLLIITGGIYLLKFLGLFDTSSNTILSFSLMIYGILTVYFRFGSQSKGHLFLATAAFLLGVELFVIDNYQIVSPNMILLPSVMLIIAFSFIMLFIDNTNNKVFLYSSIGLFITAGLYIFLSGKLLFLSHINSIAGSIVDYFPVALIITGFTILFAKKD